MSTRGEEQMKAETAEAADWLVTLQGREGDADERAAFVEWLCRSPANVREFLELSALHREVEQLPGLKSLDLEALKQEFRRGRGAITELHPAGTPPTVSGTTASVRKRAMPSRWSRWGRWSKWVALAASLLVVVIAWALDPFGWHNTERYLTAVGEQRSLALADGSQVQLNVRSRLAVHIEPTLRNIELPEGEALFHVAKDPARPFRVRTPQATIEALGTQFNVHVLPHATVVSLLEGRVVVSPSSSGETPVDLKPGQEVEVSLDGKLHARPFATPNVMAWRDRRLVFDDARLEDVIAEFNRYSRRPLVLEATSLADLRITAIYDADNAQAFVNSLTHLDAIRVHARKDGAWLIDAAPPAHDSP